MKITTALLIFLALCISALAQAPAQGKDYLPWQAMTHTYCAFERVYRTTGGFVDTPLPGKSVDVFTLMRPGSDWHTHQLFDSVARPVGSYRTAITGVTVLNAAGTEACVDFTYKNAGFSGIVDTTAGGSHAYDDLPTVTWSNALKVTDRDYFGNEYPLEPIRANSSTGPLFSPVDNRHWDQNGQPGYSRYGRNLSVHMIKVLMYAFATNGGTSMGLIPRILRGALPNGGYADNEVAAGGIGPSYPSWTVRGAGVTPGAETHQYGIEWDIENPAITYASMGHSPAEVLHAYITFKAAVIASGCEFGKLNPDTGFPMTDALDQANQWVGRGVVHLNCLGVR